MPLKVEKRKEELTKEEDMRMVLTTCALGLALMMLVETATHKAPNKRLSACASACARARACG